MGGEQNGLKYRSVMIKDELLRITSDSQMSIWAIPSSCERPDKAVQFINLAFANEELGMVWRYGIEGTHYEINDDGAAELVNSAGWTNNWFTLGDYDKLKLRSDVLAAAGVKYDEFTDLANAWNDRVINSPAYGFLFDPANVRTETAACDTVRDEYIRMIGNGTVDPEVEIPKFIQKLKDSGVQAIIDDVQKQLDAWVANE
jgi:putative aldouronate transport system substrate-binding protein